MATVSERLKKIIVDTVRSRGEQAEQLRKATYERLVDVGEALLSQAKAVGELLGQAAQVLVDSTQGR